MTKTDTINLYNQVRIITTTLVQTRGPALLGWGDLRHSSVLGFTGFKFELELHGRTLS